MNARHDSHDFFQRFVPQGECVSVLFLQFRRQIYLHIIPFGQKRANLIQRPVFKYNLIACPRDSQLDISFFYLKPSVTKVPTSPGCRKRVSAFVSNDTEPSFRLTNVFSEPGKDSTLNFVPCTVIFIPSVSTTKG